MSSRFLYLHKTIQYWFQGWILDIPSITESKGIVGYFEWRIAWKSKSFQGDSVWFLCKDLLKQMNIRVIETDISKSYPLVEELKDTSFQGRALILALITKFFNIGIGESNSRLYKKLSKGLMSLEKLKSWVLGRFINGVVWWLMY